jgi:hypothetical protein
MSEMKKNVYLLFVGKPEGKGPLGILGTDGKMILKLV